MKRIENFENKKVYHNLVENSTSNCLFVFPTVSDLKAFDPILSFLKDKFSKALLYSGLVETIKNREPQKDYIFINMLNREQLKEYDVIFMMPEIFDYAYYIPEIIGYAAIPNIKIDEKFNFVISYYGIDIDKFVIINIDKDVDIRLCAQYIDFMMGNKLNVMLIGDNITCANIVNFTKTNPIVIYRKNIPLISDLLRKCEYVVGNTKPDIRGVGYQFVDMAEEIKLFESMR